MSKFFYLLGTFALLLCACNGSDGNEAQSDSLAPVSIDGDTIRISRTSDMDEWYMDVVRSDAETYVLPRDPSWVMGNCNSSYKRSGETTALFTLEYTIRLGEMDVRHQESMVLTFTSPGGGIYQGVDTYSTEAGGAAIEKTQDTEGRFTLRGKEGTGDTDGGDSKPAEGISISEPAISGITANTAVVKGSILADDGIVIEERGVCFSEKPNPSVDGSRIIVDEGIFSTQLANLYEGTVYHVRLYAKVKNKVFYGEEVSFQTLGASADAIVLTPTKIMSSQLGIKAKLPNEVGSYGLCYGLKPNPTVTDNAVPEKYRADSWSLQNLDKGETYYIRGYHVEGSKIIYYEDSEIEVETIGKSIKADAVIAYADEIRYQYGNEWITCYAGAKVIFTYAGLPEGTYRYSIQFYRVNNSGTFYGYSGTTEYSFISGGDGRQEFVIPERFYAGQKIEVDLYNIDTGVWYQVDEYSLEESK